MSNPNRRTVPERLVFVDDESSIREVFCRAFEASDYREDIILGACASGEEFIKRLPVLQPSLVVLDLVMPGMSGPDTLAAMRAHEDGQKVPVIFLTGRTEVEMIKPYESLGVIGVVHKPFDIQSLPETVVKIWNNEPLTEDEEEAAAQISRVG